jgi:phosphoglucosamine mutase
VREKTDLNNIAPIKTLIEEVEAELGDQGRVLVRYSGTEPLLRVMIEGENQHRIETLANQIAELVRKHLGVQP